MPGQVSDCRICSNGSFQDILDLGKIPLVDNFLEENELNDPEQFYPLKLIKCEDCQLVQLNYVVAKEKLFNDNYAYDMSVTNSGVKHFHSMAIDIDNKFPQHDTVLDIGSNTGTLLKKFAELGWEVQGIEPSENIYKKALERDVPTINEFFNKEVAEGIRANKGKQDIITATNVLAHIDNLNQTIELVRNLLSKDGVFIFEVPYLRDLVEKNEYDTIYHEHLSYFSVEPLKRLFERHDMELIDIEKQDIHGGSIRVYVSHTDSYPVSSSVERFYSREQSEAIHRLDKLNQFTYRVKENRYKLRKMVNKIKSQGGSIAAIGAPAKGVTLLNYCGFDNQDISFVSEKSDLKIGKYIPGTNNPVVSDEELLERGPEYALLLPWNFAESIVKNLKEYLEDGGKIIVPIPEPYTVEQVEDIRTSTL